MNNGPIDAAGDMSGDTFGDAAVVYRLRHGEAPWARLAHRIIPAPVVHQLPGAERPAIETPRELH